MVNRIVPRCELRNETLALAARIVTMPRFGLSLAKRAVNQCEDQMGLRNGMDAVFGLHHFAHAHNAEIGSDSLGGVDISQLNKPNGMPMTPQDCLPAAYVTGAEIAVDGGWTAGPTLKYVMGQ